MILSDRTLREQLDAGRIIIDPLGPNSLQPSSIDLRLDRFFRVFNELPVLALLAILILVIVKPF